MIIETSGSGATKLSYSLETFDGPLDLLLTLIHRQKIDIYDIPIARILEQYLAHIQQMNENNMEVASEFIVMACELLYIKSKMLLPREEKEEDPRAELVQALIAYSLIRETALRFSEYERHYYKRYYPTPKPYVVKYEVPVYDKNVLFDAMLNMKAEVKEAKETQKKQSVAGAIFHAKNVSVEGKVIFILRRMLKALPLGNSVMFSALFENNNEKPDLIATFLALLQLVSTGRIQYIRHEQDYVIRLNPDYKKTEAGAAPGEGLWK